MSTRITVPLSALRTSSAPSTDWTLPSTRAHCLRSPGGVRAAGGATVAGATVATGAGAAAAGGAIATGLGVATTVGAGAGAATGAGLGAAGGVAAAVAAGAGTPPWESARARLVASPAPTTIAVTSYALAPSITSRATRPPTRTASAPWRRAPLTSTAYTRPSSPRTIITGSPFNAAGHSTVPWRKRGSPGAASAGKANASTQQRALTRRFIG